MLNFRPSYWYLFLGVLIGAWPAQQSVAQIQLNEVAVAAGIGSDNFNSSSAHGLGAIWIDYDNDGFPDLFVANGSSLPSHLYRNEGNGTFSNQDDLLPAGLIGEPTSAMFADYDNDGDQDIYITVANLTPDVADGGANHLLQNQWVENGNQLLPGQPLFIDVAAAAGVDNLASPALGALPGYASYTGAWLDYDRDSCIDLFVGNMDWDEAGTSSNKNFLYKNNCDGTFTDVTVASGVDTGDTDDWRPSLAFFGGLLTPGDIDPDLYVVNVHDFSPFHHDLIYQNNGDGTFTEFGDTMPGFGDDSGAGMGTAVADIDLDGDWDIYLSDLPDPGNEPVAEGNPLYLGNPDGTWSENAAPAAGVESFSSWGVNFVDLDQDGFEDLFVGTIAPNNAVKSVFHNNGDGTFADVTASSGFPTQFPARGTAIADYDRDGDMDIVQVNLNDRIILFENVTTGQGNWLQVDLEATVSNRSAIGTLLEATTGGTTRMRQINGGASAHSQDELVVHFGLGSATNIDELKISWPSGEVQILTNVGVNQMITVTEPNGGGGSGTLVVTPGSIDFGQQEEGTTSAPAAITLSNTGTAALDVTGVSISGADAVDFSDTFGGSVMIPAGGSSTFDVTFTPSAAAAPLMGDVIYRVNAGGDLVSDWEEDSDTNPSAYVNESATATQSTTSAITLDSSVPAGTPEALFQTVRIDAAKADPVMEWDFPVTAGDELTIRLFFAEIIRCQNGSHIFDVVIEGTTVLEEYDPFAEVGCEVGTMKEFVVTAGDNNLDIDFPLGGNNRPPIIAAIEIESESGGTGGADIRTAQLDVTHTGSNPSQSVSLTGEATTDGGGGNDAPVAAFTFAATDLDVSFTDGSSDSDGSVVSWSWDFGDGNSSTGQNPDHTYAAAGTYTVALTVTDDAGATGATSQSVTVTDGTTAGTMHIESITTSVVRGGGTGHVEAVITIVDENGNPVETATVSGTFSDDVSGADTQDTNASGEAMLMSDAITVRPQTISVCVDNVTHATLTYDPGANSDPGFACSAAPSAARSGADQLALTAGLPTEFALESNYPNPFNPTTTIRFDVPEASDVRLEVYDLMGRRVATLVNGQMAAGRYEATWNARSDAGASVASGVYLYRMQAGSFESVQRMVLMK
ncbi:MAG: FG-GAP-like repeat-containing protein [Bacteroidota bacterium]